MARVSDPKAWRFPIWLVLAVTFGGLAAMAIAIVAVVINYIAVRNTSELIDVIANREIVALEHALATELDPALEQVRFLSGYLASAKVAPDDEARLSDLLMGSLAASPQLTAVAFIRTDLKVIAASRQLDGKLYVNLIQDGLRDAGYRQAYRMGMDAREPVWGRPVFVPELGKPVMSALAPVRRRGEPLGVFTAVISLPEISQHLKDRAGPNTTPFVLGEKEVVFSHRNLFSDDFHLDSERPLPRFNEINDPVLARFDRSESFEVTPAGALSQPFREQIVTVGEGSYVIIFKDVPDLVQQPLTIGVHLQSTVVDSAFAALRRTFYGAALVIFIAIVFALILGRRIGEPVRAFADAARHLAALDFGGAPVLARSRFKEIDVAAGAYNKMRAGLGWFSTYVPQSLVPHLMRPSSSEVLSSREVEVTVLFTDIVGFSGIAQRLSPQRLAAFLNRHFSLLGGHIVAEGGSIDKYIGDSIMAFWGAPEAQADHALRAVRAAQAIKARLGADNARRARKGLTPVRIRIGIHSGLAIAGNIGAPGRINYTLVGDTVNIAQRLEQFGKQVDDGTSSAVVSISADAARLLPSNIELVSLGAEVLPGRLSATEIYRLK
jgi:adenylate cyclase